MVQKRNSHYAPQPYTNQSVFKSFLNYTSEIWRRIQSMQLTMMCVFGRLMSQLADVSTQSTVGM